MYNKTKFIIILSTVITVLASCVTKMPISSSLFDTSKKTGIIVVNEGIATYEFVDGRLVKLIYDVKRFKEPLDIVDKKLNTKNIFSQHYSGIFLKHNIQLKNVQGKLTLEYLDAFKKPNSKKKYAKKDFRFFKEKYNIDRLVVVDVNFGLLLSKSGLIVLEKFGLCMIETEIIDLEDNSLLFKDNSKGEIKVEGKWKTPPNYDNLYAPIRKALENVLMLETIKLR